MKRSKYFIGGVEGDDLNKIVEALKEQDKEYGTLREVCSNVLGFTEDEITFILWMLGFICGSVDKLDDEHREYIVSHHNELLPKIQALRGE